MIESRVRALHTQPHFILERAEYLYLESWGILVIAPHLQIDLGFHLSSELRVADTHISVSGGVGDADRVNLIDLNLKKLNIFLGQNSDLLHNSSLGVMKPDF